MSAQKSKLSWIKNSCIVGATLVSMNVLASEPTVWSNSSGTVVNDGSGNCLHTIWWQKDGSCGKNADTHTHGAMEHTHEGGSKPHQHEQAAEPKAAPAPVAAAPVAKASPAAVPFSLSSAAAFKTSGASLSAEGKAEVKAFAAKLEGHEVNSITVEGYTDDRGPASFNQDLSEKRAKAVKAEMIDNGIDASLIKVIGHGESNPIADNATKEGRAKNRRVVVSVDTEK